MLHGQALKLFFERCNLQQLAHITHDPPTYTPAATPHCLLALQATHAHAHPTFLFSRLFLRVFLFYYLLFFRCMLSLLPCLLLLLVLEFRWFKVRLWALVHVTSCVCLSRWFLLGSVRRLPHMDRAHGRAGIMPQRRFCPTGASSRAPHKSAKVTPTPSSLARCLRHRAGRICLPMKPGGFVKLKDMLKDRGRFVEGFTRGAHSRGPIKVTWPWKTKPYPRKFLRFFVWHHRLVPEEAHLSHSCATGGT